MRDIAIAKEAILRHENFTNSAIAKQLLASWNVEVSNFRKVMPRDYKKVLAVLALSKEQGLSEEETSERVMEVARG